jgi:hypothetical protein
MRKFILAAAVLCIIPSSSQAQAQGQQPCPMVFESVQTLFVDSFVDRMICLQQSLSTSTTQIVQEAEAAPLFEAPQGAENAAPAGEAPAL